jgi:hypothetical protein
MRSPVKSVVLALAALGVVSAATPSQAVLQGFLKLTNEYYYDSATLKPFVPHGIAYQTWNRPLGVWQTWDQIIYDLDEMVKMGANAVRVDFVWQHLEEQGDNIWSWANYDFLVQECEKRDIRIFALIGYQWPPNWFPDEWYTMHPPEIDAEGIYHPTRWQSDIINYEHPLARAQYTEWFSNVCSRYKNSKAIAGWIIGNESGYLGLWSGLLDGYDPYCEAAFRNWTSNKYVTIAAANAAWGTTFTNFNQVVFVEQYRAYGQEGAIWADMVQWREDSIGSFTALGAKAAKAADTNHLISYSTVGMQWGEEDWRYHAEDRGKITAACISTGAPVDFFSVNNYPWSILGHESQNGQWGISYTKKVAKVPVTYSETGFTSSETMWPGLTELRQGPLIRNSLWESLLAGANGTHIFSWMDRPYITDREKGFGILTWVRTLKPSYYVSRDTFTMMQQVRISDMLAGSKDPTPDIAFLWTAAADSQYNRYECEMQQICGALERLGYEPNFLDLADMGARAFTNYRVIILPRNMRVDDVIPNSTNKTTLDFLRQDVIGKGVHIMATADIPGMQDFNGKPRAQFSPEVQALFGIDPADIGGYEVPQRRRNYVSWYWKKINVTFNTNAVGAVAGGYSYAPHVWKYSDEVTLSTGGVAWAYMDSGRNKGFENNGGSSNNPVAPWNTWGNIYVRTNWGWQYSGLNMVQMWGDSGMWADFECVPFGRYTHNAYLRNNAGDPLNNNAAAGLSIEWYGENGEFLGSADSTPITGPTLSGGSTSDAPNMVVNPGFETNGAGWSYNGQLGIEGGYAAYAAETGSYGAWITNNAGEHSIYQIVPTNVWAPKYGSTFVYRVRAKKAGTVPGNIKLELYHPWVLVTNIDITASLTTNWQTFALYYKPAAGWDQALELRLRNATGGSGTGQVMYDNVFFGITNTTVTASGDAWVKHSIQALAPSNAFTGRRIIRIGPNNLLANGELTGTSPAPTGWQNWNDANHDPETASYLGTNGNAWAFWYDGGIYQDVTNGFAVGNTIQYGGLLYQPSWNIFSNGTKKGRIDVEFYNGAALISTNTAQPTIDWGDSSNVWLWTTGSATVPSGCNKIRVIVRCADFATGDGRFFADNIYLRNSSLGGGSVYVDNLATNPAVVVKNHGAAKSAIFMYSAGDTKPDGNDDGEMDTGPWKNRYDIFGAVVKDYFGVQPKIYCTGTNAFLTLPEYRTLTNGGYLLQLKNYLYDTNYPNGGSGLTFTVTSTLFTGKTVVALDRGQVLEQNSDGTFPLYLEPDGNEMVYIYNPGTNKPYFVRIQDAPPLVHPFGDKTFEVRVKYDTLGYGNHALYVAFQENGNNGDALTNEIYTIQTNIVSGTGEAVFNMYIRDFDPGDTDYISTFDGGKYIWSAWLASNGGTKAVSVPMDVQLNWGTRPIGTWTSTVTKGGSVTNTIEWENMYETLFWQNTPMSRGDAYPNRVAIYRSTKTESNYPGHLAKANAVADWLETMGYRHGEPIDLMFDNVIVTGKMTENFDDGNYTGWTREAGALNWTVEDSARTPALYGSAINYDTQTTFNMSQALYRLSFKVQAPDDKTISQLYLYGSKVGTSPTYRVTLYEDEGGYPAGTQLVSQTFTMPSASAGWVGIDIPDYMWAQGQCYHFVVDYVSGTINGTNRAAFQYVRPNQAPRNVLTSTNGGALWTVTGYDPVFRIVYDNTNQNYAQAYASASAVNVISNTYYGQVFKPTLSMKITNIALFMRKSATTVNNDPSLVLYTWPGKSLLASSSVARASIATTNNWVPFGLGAGVNVTASNLYMFEIRNKSDVLGMTTGAYVVLRANGLGNYGIYTFGGTSDYDVVSTTAGTSYTAEVHYDLEYRLATATTGMALRAWRIGNDDNIIAGGTSTWSDVTVSSDMKYNKKGYYFNDAELYLRYVNRDNYYKVGIRNFYGFWRIRYMVKVAGTVHQVNWLYDFPKTNQPQETVWYNLKVDSKGSTNMVYLNNNYIGVFYATNHPTGKIALGSKATQLGIWEPAKGYYFIDDDEYGYSANPNVNGPPLNLDYGYLVQFFPTLILPGVYVMNDAEASNLVTYANSGYFGIMSTDGGVAMKNQAGAFDLGRVESVFGVAPSVSTITNISKFTITITNQHYVTVDYPPGSSVNATGTANAYVSVAGTGKDLALITNGGSTRIAAIVNVTGPDTNAPTKVVTFNFPADTQGQLTNTFTKIARRAFEWIRGQALRYTVELRYRSNTTNEYEDFTVYSTNGWILAGSGLTNIVLNIPTNNVMTGSNLYWVSYIYPAEAGQPFRSHTGFYTSDNNTGNTNVTLAGIGLQVLGITDYAYHGRDWDKWVAYDIGTNNYTMEFGLKDKGNLGIIEDSFSLGNTSAWSVTHNSNITWRITNGALRAIVNVGTGGYSFITYNGQTLSNTNVTVSVDMAFGGGAKDGGIIYRGRVLHVNANRIGWEDGAPNYVTSTNLYTDGRTNRIIVSVRDGVPYRRTDLLVNNYVIFRDEPLQSTNWTTNTVGMLSPYSNAASFVQWDNFRLDDEQYATVWTNAQGVSYPTNTIPTATWPSVPDYDPAMLEHNGTSGGSKYEWFITFRGQGHNAQLGVEMWLSPRLMVEATNFPKTLSPGSTYYVPIEWEELKTNLPIYLEVRLEEPYLGTNVGSTLFMVTNSTGSGSFPVTLPLSVPAGTNWLWLAYMYPTYATNPMLQRLGLDDTFRFSPEPFGAPTIPETVITVTSVSTTNFLVYTDAGIPFDSTIYQWGGSWTYFDHNFTGVAGIPEGTKCTYASGGDYTGWGVFHTNGPVNMSAFSNGQLRFSAKTPQNLTVEIEDFSGYKAWTLIPNTTNNWATFSITLTNMTPYSLRPDLAAIKGLFMATTPGGQSASNYIDNVRWTR